MKRFTIWFAQRSWSTIQNGAKGVAHFVLTVEGQNTNPFNQVRPRGTKHIVERSDAFDAKPFATSELNFRRYVSNRSRDPLKLRLE